MRTVIKMPPLKLVFLKNKVLIPLYSYILNAIINK